MFLAIQLVSFAFWQGAQLWDNNIENQPDSNTDIQHEVAYDFDHVRFVAKGEESGVIYISEDMRDRFISVFKTLPTEHTATLETLMLDFSPDAYRGLGGKTLIIIRAANIDPAESIAVLIHEIGHTVDLGHLKHINTRQKSAFTDNSTPIYIGDPSLDFYKISWRNDKIRKSSASNLDFVSGYALTDPFEDFAESYVYYVLHNKDFKSKAKTSAVLYQKYQFMKNKVFNGKEFDTGKVLYKGLNNRPWDITLMEYDLNKFLSIYS